MLRYNSFLQAMSPLHFFNNGKIYLLLSNGSRFAIKESYIWMGTSCHLKCIPRSFMFMLRQNNLSWNKETSLSTWLFFFSWQKIQVPVAQKLGSKQEIKSLENKFTALGSQESFVRFPTLTTSSIVKTAKLKVVSYIQISKGLYVIVYVYTSLTIQGENLLGK